jgi:hypothetical protein
MITSLGLLTTAGLDHFWTIFEDYENLGNRQRDVNEFLVPEVPPFQGQPVGQERIRWETARAERYRAGLKAVSCNSEDMNRGHTFNADEDVCQRWD